MNRGLRYQADEKPPLVHFPRPGSPTHRTQRIRHDFAHDGCDAGRRPEREAYLSWAVFAAVVIGGGATMLQALRLGRFGMGQVLMMGSSGAFIAVSIQALAEGGPATLATLVVVAALFQFIISDRLSLFRRVLTPAVSGTVLMLIPVSVMSPVLNLLKDVPDGSPAPGAPLSALATVLVICGLTLKASGSLRLWASVLGVLAGSLVAVFFGIYDTARVAEAAWVGLPSARMAGPRSRLRADILDASSRVFAGGHHRRHPDGQQRRRRPARLLAPAPGGGFPGGAGRGGRRRSKQPALRPRGNDAEHVLHDGRIPGPTHRGREPPPRDRRRCDVHRTGVFFRKRSPWCWPYRGRSSPPISS